MSLYLRAKKIDEETGEAQVVLLHEQDAEEKGINAGDIVSLSWRDIELYVIVDTTNTVVNRGEIGLFEDIWTRYAIPADHIVVITEQGRPESIEYIKKKLLGKKLTEHELEVIMSDIAKRKIREVEVAYFMATFFNPGFDEDEVLWTAKGMANSGEILDFKGIKDGNEIVVDKHSIGGVAAKGVTPVLVPILAAAGLVVPNTSTRAITTPAGTSDILEVVMPVSHSTEDLYKIVKKAGACMVWGGSMSLAPADDVLIHVERGLHIQSYQKLLVSIVAKKIAMGVTHILIDIPYGKGTKVEDPNDVELLASSFVKLYDKVGIKCEIYPRHVTTPDGRGIGPNLEMRDILRIFERHPDRPLPLESLIIDMAGQVLELAGVAERSTKHIAKDLGMQITGARSTGGKGSAMAREILESGRAAEKFWEIAMAQGARDQISSADIELGEFTHEVYATASQVGKVKVISNREIVNVARSLGTPFIKEAGIYLEKMAGDHVAEGDLLMTLYASSPERLELGKQALDLEKMWTVG